MKALIALSGGVDSSVAAYLTQKEGYDCIGCTMKLYTNEDCGISKSRTCCSLEDVEDARSVAYRLGMPYYVFNFTEAFRKTVIQDFVRSYERGTTPNPCIDCNRYMKFEKLYERARILGCDRIVTGHYARIVYEDQRFLLKKAADETKDQSYVLYTMTQDLLAHTAFPLGEMKKTQVRQLADELGFVNARKPDSQDICFVPSGDYAAFLETYTGKTYPRGDFVDGDGTVLGRHKGIVHYTIGQRRGLGLSRPEPLYVTGIDTQNDRIVLGSEQDLYAREALVESFNWIAGEGPATEIRCKVKIRYRQPEQWATLHPLDQTTVQVVFDTPQRAITPGQAAVAYDGDIVLGGGVIKCAD